MSTIDTARVRSLHIVTPMLPEEVAALCDEIDALRAELEGERLARIDAENGKRIANEYADAAEAKVAAVEALCDLWEHGSHFRVAARKIRAAISGPVDDA